MVSVKFLKVCCQSDISFSCCLGGYCGLVNDIRLKAFPSSGQSGFFLQLQGSGCCVGAAVFERTCLLRDEMIDFMFGMLECVCLCLLYFRTLK